MPLLLHAGHSVSLSAWDLHPSVIGIALIVIGLYMYTASKAEAGFEARRIPFFVLGFAAMFLALVSPLDAAAHRLLSMHMLQHVALTTIGPPLVLLGISAAQLRPLFESRLGPILRAATNPVVAGTLFIVNMWLWHIPPVYDSALNHLGVHIGMHVAFMATGLLFWWPVVRPLPEQIHTSEGARLLYLFVTGFPMALLALLLLSSNNVIYGFYGAGPRQWGISPIADQQVAGMIMGALGEAASFVAITLLFFRYLDREEAAAPSAHPGAA
ncbi:MAG TPA: cytochrome c oxidase assembly protein [Dehalococcoidia bacterium]|nr:cytochrome c oxidase assembly protein [Dehalococcoidia bacterium]